MLKINIKFKTMQITQNDLYMQFHSETGHYAENYPKEYHVWLENIYLSKLNEERELNDKITEFMLQDEE